MRTPSILAGCVGILFSVVLVAADPPYVGSELHRAVRWEGIPSPAGRIGPLDPNRRPVMGDDLHTEREVGRKCDLSTVGRRGGPSPCDRRAGLARRVSFDGGQASVRASQARGVSRRRRSLRWNSRSPKDTTWCSTRAGQNARRTLTSATIPSLAPTVRRESRPAESQRWASAGSRSRFTSMGSKWRSTRIPCLRMARP